MTLRIPPASRSNKESGAAVILVLSLLVLVAVLTLAFLARTRTELVTADISGRALAARRLAQLASDSVQVQILEATTNDESPVWASQPGMIRTYNEDGSASTRYKLFSASSMISDGESYDAATEDSIPENWEQATSEYVDLNAREGIRYPIADPTAAEERSVIGFDIGAGETNVPAGSTSDLPMPVKWLYVLEDGTQVAPVSAGFGQDSRGLPTQTVRVPGATETNPITGRIAYWTDDETTKVNINTAFGQAIPGEGDVSNAGGFNATPRYASEPDARALSARAPVKNEYQRYRGHPSNVSLSAVFPELDDEALGRLAPRATTDFTSRNGTTATSLGQEAAVNEERLYSSIDELAFNSQRESSSLDSSDINQRRFFLTTRSSSSDLTPFGTPKISLVPGDENGNVTAERRLANFSATLRPRSGGNGFRPDPYFFSRTNALDPSVDLGSPEPANKPNERLYGYLQRMLDSEIPGFDGGAFSDKFGPRNSYQLGLSIYDYIRASHLTGSDFAPNGVIYPTVDDRAPQDTKVAGYGRMEILTEFGIALVPIANLGQRTVDVVDGESVSPQNFIVREYAALALLEAFVPGQGYPAYGQDFVIEIQGLPRLGIQLENGFVTSEETPSMPLRRKTIALFPPEADAEMLCRTTNTGFSVGQRGWGGVISPSVYLTAPEGAGPRTLERPGEEPDPANYPFFGDSIFVYFPADDSAETSNPFKIGDFGQPGAGTGTAPVDIGIAYKSSEGTGAILALYTAQIGGASPLLANAPAWLQALIPGGSVVPPVMFPQSPLQTLDARIAKVVDRDSRNESWQELLDVQDVVRTSQMLNTFGAPEDQGDLRITAPKIFSLDLLVPPLLPRPDMVLPDLSLITGSTRTLSEFQSLHSFTTNTGLIYPVQNPAIDTGGGDMPLGYSRLIEGLSTEYLNNSPPASHEAGDPVVMTNWSNFVDGAIATTASNVPGDWDNGAGLARPGPYLNFPDEGHHLGGQGSTDAYYDPFATEGNARSGAETGSDRLPSAAMLGSLPTGVYAEGGFTARPWETLLFSPAAASGTAHFSYVDRDALPNELRVPDHALLEFFRTPVVRPYALSLPAASSGRVNLNSSIVPFTYLRRETALIAALAAERITTPTNSGAVFSGFKGQASGALLGDSFYSPIDIGLTLEGIRLRFEEGELYRYPSEICDIFLVPSGQGFEEYNESQLDAYWENVSQTGLVGDNERERPYASLYPKLTTKSNSYVVHVRAQVIRKARSGEVDEFDSETDSVAGEWRGSFHLERTLPPSEPGIPDYATETLFPTDGGSAPPSLEKFHRIRVERVERFAPALADERQRTPNAGGLPGLL